MGVGREEMVVVYGEPFCWTKDWERYVSAICGARAPLLSPGALAMLGSGWGGGGGGVQSLSCTAVVKKIYPGIPTMRRRSTSVFHRKRGEAERLLYIGRREELLA